MTIHKSIVHVRSSGMLCSVAVSYWCFRTTYQSHLHGSVFLDSLTLEYEAEKVPLNIGNYQSRLCNVPEEQMSHLHGGGSVKSRKSIRQVSEHSSLHILKRFY